MIDIKKIIEKSGSSAAKSSQYISRHRTVIVILVICVAVLAAVMQTQKYLNPVRNEDKYTELRSGIKTKSIDTEIVLKLEQTQQDQDSIVDSNFVPDRTNPFVE